MTLFDTLYGQRMEAPWPVLDPAVLGFLQTTRNLQAAFESVDDCCGLIAAKFPDMIDEELGNIAADMIPCVFSGKMRLGCHPPEILCVLLGQNA